jgi:ribonuclease P protein component, mitochondrial
MRPFRNISSKQKGSFAFSRKCSSSSPNTSTTHQFFNPSYIPPKDLIRVDEIGYKSNHTSNSNNQRSIFKYVAPALSVTKNYVIFDSNFNHEKTNNVNLIKSNFELSTDIINHNHKLGDFDKLILRKLKNQNNKNGHLNISIDHITDNHTVLNVRRASSTNVKKLLIPNKQFTQDRSYTTDNLQKDLQNLNLGQQASQQQEKVLQQEQDQKQDQVLKTQTVQELHEPTQSSQEEILDVFLHSEDPVQTQLHLVNNMIRLNKWNEILPLFHRMRNNDIVPNLAIYKKVLTAISMRETDEVLEVRLTHLLNTYSDMLSINLKPDNEVYEIVINQLVKGSLNSYKIANFKNGYEFFKIALDLFLINEKTYPANQYADNSIYINLIKCLNYYKIENSVSARDLFNTLHSKISEKNLSQFYSQIMKFATLCHDISFVEELYNNDLKPLTSVGKKNNDVDHDLIYQTLIESYNLSSEFKKSSLLLDTVLNNIPAKTTVESQRVIEKYLSKYMKSLALKDPQLSLKMLYKFNKIEWLPQLSVDALVFLSYTFLKQNDLPMALKVWDFTILRNDFDNSLSKGSAMSDEYSIYTSNFIQSFYQIILNTSDKNLIFKAVREILAFNSIKLSDVTLIHYIQYLNSIREHEMVVKLIINQGYKKIMGEDIATSPKVSLNNYLSMMVDILPTSQLSALFNSAFFKRVVEEYRLVTDNIYGIMKTILKVAEMETESPSSMLKLRYYAKVIDYELEDVDNTYVQIPKEIEDFKQQLQTYI